MFSLLRNSQLSFARFQALTRRGYKKHVKCNQGKLAKKSERQLQSLFGLQQQDKHNKGSKSQKSSRSSWNGNITVGSQRRAQQLSVYLQEQIANTFYQGEVCPKLNDYSFEIEKVRISADFNHLNVYWNSSGKADRDSAIEELLEESKADLRTALTQKNLIGRIPPITFLKDTTKSHLELVESLLKKADMGPDHIPTDIGHNLREPRKSAEPVLHPPQSAATQQMNISGYASREGPGGTREILWSNKVSESETPPEVPSKPILNGSQQGFSVTNKYRSDIDRLEATNLDHVLRSDVYSLNHAELSNKVTQLKRKAKDRKYEVSESQDSVPDSPQGRNSKAGPTAKSMQQYLAKRYQQDINKYKRQPVNVLSFEESNENDYSPQDSDGEDNHYDDDFEDAEDYKDFQR